MGVLNDLRQKSNIVAIIILVFVATTMSLFSSMMVKRLAQDERNKMEVMAEAYRVLFIENSNNVALNMALQIIHNNETIPLIITDEIGNISEHRNIRIPKKDETTFLQNKRIEFLEDKTQPPIKINYETGGRTFVSYIYYGRSNLLKQLSYFPIWQTAIILFFMLLAYLFFNVSKRAEEDRVWVGLSKETAHQLGTPISSLLAWIDLMRSGITTPDMADEMQKDITRLQTVANRFSKIGSKPTLEMYNLTEVLDDSATYMSRRITKRVSIIKEYDKENFIPVMINTELFEWVIENLVKNAVDAMRGGGKIWIAIIEEEKQVIVDFSDEGKGIPKNKFSEVFKPGYSSKKRGWGLGLSFAKRIVKDYHKGKIFVKKSEIDKGTTFRFILPKCTIEEGI